MDYGGAAGGAMAGAQMGSMFGPIGTGVGAVAGGLLGAFGGKKGKQGEVQAFYPKWMTQPGYEGATAQSADYMTNQMGRLGRGEMPLWFERAAPAMRRQMTDPLYKMYYGSQGNRTGGMIGQAYETGALTGLGPKATFLQAQKAQNDYADKMKQIDDTMTMMGAGALQQSSQDIPNFIAQRTQLAQPQLMNMPGQAASNPYASLMGNSGMMQGGMGALGSMFSGMGSGGGYGGVGGTAGMASGGYSGGGGNFIGSGNFMY